MCMKPYLNRQLLPMLLLVWMLTIIIHGTATRHGDILEKNILYVGEELMRETLPLQSGLRVYELHGLKSFTWYEVKISYPASIPASFSVQLRKGNSDLELNQNRKLLNTEKLIFRTGRLEDHSNEGGLFVSVTVEPEGVVAIKNAKERESIVFNIVCDELFMFIPYNAWWVIICGLLCLGMAIIIPPYLPSYLLFRSTPKES